jgi:hypothetical protein
VWDILKVSATILTIWLSEDDYKTIGKITRWMSIFNRRDECQGIGLLYNRMDELDEQYEGRALRARTAPSRTSIAIKKDKDCMMDD